MSVRLPKPWNEIRILQEGDPVSAERTNQPLADLYENIEYLYNNVANIFQETVFRHYEVFDITIGDGYYDSNTGTTKLVVGKGEDALKEYYKNGNDIVVNGEMKTIVHSDFDDSNHPDQWWIWVTADENEIYNAGAYIELGNIVQSVMVYVPKIKIPKDGISLGLPAENIVVGGFYVDKYENSLPGTNDKTSTAYKSYFQSVSQAGVIPCKSISFNQARQVASNRIINGRRCKMIGMKEFSEILLIAKYIGVVFRGNDDYGKFSGDDDEEHNYGQMDQELGYALINNRYYRQACLTGTGPRWNIFGTTGICDIYGNLREYVECKVETGLYVHRKKLEVVFNAPAYANNFIAKIETPYAWNSSGKIIVGVTEYQYNNLESIGGGLYRFTLEGNIGGNGLPAGTIGYQETKYCVIPNGTRGINENTLSEGEIDPVDIVCHNNDVVTARTGEPFVVGDIIQIRGTFQGNPANEQLTIVGINYTNNKWYLLCNRGEIQVETSPGQPFVVISPDMNNVYSTGDAYQSGKIIDFRTEPDLSCLLIPQTTEVSEDRFCDYYLKHWGTRCGVRGTCWHDKGYKGSHYLEFLLLDEESTYDVGFRTVYIYE